MKSISSAPAHGVISIFTCPKSLAKAIEWAFQTEFQHFQIDWQISDVDPTQLCASLTWNSILGTASRLSSELIKVPGVRFEVTEIAPAAGHHERFAFTPNLGLFRADLDAAGNAIFTEHRLQALLTENPNPLNLPAAIRQLVGADWDSELDVYRGQEQMQNLRLANAVG